MEAEVRPTGKPSDPAPILSQCCWANAVRMGGRWVCSKCAADCKTFPIQLDDNLTASAPDGPGRGMETNTNRNRQNE